MTFSNLECLDEIFSATADHDVFILNNSGHSHEVQIYLMKYDVGL